MYAIFNYLICLFLMVLVWRNSSKSKKFRNCLLAFGSYFFLTLLMGGGSEGLLFWLLWLPISP